MIVIKKFKVNAYANSRLGRGDPSLHTVPTSVLYT